MSQSINESLYLHNKTYIAKYKALNQHEAEEEATFLQWHWPADQANRIVTEPAAWLPFIVAPWNCLPAKVVDFGSLNRFKRSIKLVDLSKFLTVDSDT